MARASPATLRDLVLPDPMLATAGEAGDLRGDGWVGEFKWDGVRAVVGVVPGVGIRVRTRRGADATTRWPEIARLAEQVEHPVVLDGEVCALDERGRPSFSLLQRRMHVARPGADLVARVGVSLQVFDVLQVGDERLLDTPYHERRARLEQLGIGASRTVAVPPVTPVGGAGIALESLLAVAEQHGLEGVVAKRADSRYRPGVRAREWRKFRLQLRQEFVVVGYQVGRSGAGLGSLLLAVHDVEGGTLHGVGSAGSGLTDADRERWQHQLDERRVDAPPVDPDTWPGRETLVFARPELVAEVRFTEWTPDGRLRQPVLLGQRDDRDPATIVREVPPVA